MRNSQRDDEESYQFLINRDMMKVFTCLSIVILLLNANKINSTSSAVCPGAPQSNYRDGHLSCSLPSWTVDCYTKQLYYPSPNPAKYFQCTSVSVLERSCAPGTCFQPSLRRCTFASTWINECLEYGIALNDVILIKSSNCVGCLSQDHLHQRQRRVPLRRRRHRQPPQPPIQ